MKLTSFLTRIASAAVVGFFVLPTFSQLATAQSGTVISDPVSYGVYRAVVPKVTSSGEAYREPRRASYVNQATAACS